MEEVKLNHQVQIKSREKAVISGTAEVDSFDENRVVLITQLGVLVIKGTGLHIQSLSVDSGDVTVNGHIDSMEYIDSAGDSTSFWGKLFR